jgi:hypothetical protein
MPAKRGINAGHERGVLESPDDFGVFFADEIPQVPARFKIAERIVTAWLRADSSLEGARPPLG